MSDDSSSIISTLESLGFGECQKHADTLQGSIWKSLHKATQKHVVIKATNKKLHKQQIGITYDGETEVQENIKKENTILKYLTKDQNCPDSIVKHLGCFKSDSDYFIMMQDGGKSLFDFVVQAHALITINRITIPAWHKLVKIIFKQMIECIEYIHSKNVCHFDISLENFLINDIDCLLNTENKKLEFCGKIQVKLCDFGLSEIFSNKNFECNKYCGKTNYQSPEISSKVSVFSAQSNDIWCLGICLFMMIIGGCPWNISLTTDESFNLIMDGHMLNVLYSWDKLGYVDKYTVQVFASVFKLEDKRVTIDELKRCQWLLKD